MNIREKRVQLQEYCRGTHCYADACPLRGTTCRCGCGTTFTAPGKILSEDGSRYDMSDQEIEEAYQILTTETVPFQGDLDGLYLGGGAE